MKRISSGSIGFMKRGFLPVFAAAMAVAALSAVIGIGLRPLALAVLPLPLFMVGVVWALTRTLVMPLADEVWDGGDHLLVRKDGLEDRIALADIDDIQLSKHVKPPRITLVLGRPGPLGDRVVFAPVTPMVVSPDAADNPVAKDLLRRRRGGLTDR